MPFPPGRPFNPSQWTGREGAEHPPHTGPTTLHSLGTCTYLNISSGSFHLFFGVFIELGAHWDWKNLLWGRLSVPKRDSNTHVIFKTCMSEGGVRSHGRNLREAMNLKLRSGKKKKKILDNLNAKCMGLFVLSMDIFVSKLLSAASIGIKHMPQGKCPTVLHWRRLTYLSLIPGIVPTCPHLYLSLSSFLYTPFQDFGAINITRQALDWFSSLFLFSSLTFPRMSFLSPELVNSHPSVKL